MTASEMIENGLRLVGMNQEEIDMLLAQFLEEVAFGYVECILKLQKSDNRYQWC